jgi:hypothetical protein
MKPFVLLGLALVMVTFRVNAQDLRIPIYIDDSAHDGIGESIVHLMKEKIRTSSGMRLVGSKGEGVVIVYFLSDKPDDRRPQTYSMYSVVWTISHYGGGMGNAYITQHLGQCGAIRVDSCALSLVAITDKVASPITAAPRH